MQIYITDLKITKLWRTQMCADRQFHLIECAVKHGRLPQRLLIDGCRLIKQVLKTQGKPSLPAKSFLSCTVMKIQFRAIGKNHEPHFKQAIELFTARVQHYFPLEWKIIAPSKASNQREACAAETRLLIQKTPGDVIVALDERGKSMDSPTLARFIESQSFASTKNIVFAIGGAYGFDRALLPGCDMIWSLSELTFPHQLVRLILAEQVYRACTIIRREGYHHEG